MDTDFKFDPMDNDCLWLEPRFGNKLRSRDLGLGIRHFATDFTPIDNKVLALFAVTEDTAGYSLILVGEQKET